MRRRPPTSTRTDTLLPSTPLFRTGGAARDGRGRRRGRPGEPRRRAGCGPGRAPRTAARDRGAGGTGAGHDRRIPGPRHRSEEHTSELQSLMRISYAVFCLKKKNKNKVIYSLNDNEEKAIHHNSPLTLYTN